MDNVRRNEAKSPKIEVIETCGEWFVRVIEDGGEATTSFELETFAMVYAEGQRLRLGLEKV
ncbi:hypothetical protein [Mesorhizobium silamurunense]|uniref:hypothetical protein n=1 Tax=Mesorhizobium silamurunense TaxID=499528 RepID=UPI001784EF5D|nr:hypothetical protein [Mesorhizobium silamurunense]